MTDQPKPYDLDKIRAARYKRNLRIFKKYFANERCKKYYHPLSKIAEARNVSQ